MWGIILTVLLIALLVGLVPAIKLQRGMREVWLMPGLFSVILATTAVRSWIRFGFGPTRSVALDLLFPGICAVIALVEGGRAIRRRSQAGGSALRHK
jgi:hypothetical protein